VYGLYGPTDRHTTTACFRPRKMPHTRCAGLESCGHAKDQHADSCRHVCKRTPHTRLSLTPLHHNAHLCHGELTPNSSVRLLFLLKSILLDALLQKSMVEYTA
jgi:hypothetical protein